MDLFKKLNTRALGPNVKLVAIPITILCAVVILFAYLIKIGQSQISKKLAELRAGQKSEKVFSDKLSVLRQVEKEVTTDTEVTVLALPHKNPGLLSISQLRRLAIDNQLAFEGLEFTNERVKDGLTSMELKMDLAGQDALNIVNFLSDIQDLAPITTIEEVSIEESKEGGWHARMKVSVYWSSLPTTLPKLNEPAKELVAKEVEILGVISDLKPPTFSILEPSTPTSRTIPFN